MSRRALVLAATLVLGACTEPLPPQTGLAGRWIEEGVALESARDFLIGDAEVFVYTVPHADGGATFIVGTWSVEGDRITFTTTSKTEYPASGPSQKTDPYVDEHFYEDATFSLTLTTLTLTFLSYATGTPVVTTIAFRRDED